MIPTRKRSLLFFISVLFSLSLVGILFFSRDVASEGPTPIVSCGSTDLGILYCYGAGEGITPAGCEADAANECNRFCRGYAIAQADAHESQCDQYCNTLGPDCTISEVDTPLTPCSTYQQPVINPETGNYGCLAQGSFSLLCNCYKLVIDDPIPPDI